MNLFYKIFPRSCGMFLLVFVIGLLCGCKSSEPIGPRLMLNQEELKAVKHKVEKYAWAKQQWNAIKASADKILEMEVNIPPRGGNWTHYYVSPDDGRPLVTGEQIGPWQWQHKSATGGHIYYGDTSNIRTDYDGVVISRIHDRWAERLVDLGLAFQITGAKKYGEKGKEILKVYAGKYLDYEVRFKDGSSDIKKGAARVFVQSLDESGWLVNLTIGADLIWKFLKEDDRTGISDSLLIPSAKIIGASNRGVHNIQSWQNAAIGLTGFLTRNDSMVNIALEHPDYGFQKQVDKGLTTDGHWYERAPFYHFYALTPLVVLAEAAYKAGQPAYLNALKKMLDAPLSFSMPNLDMPRFNDSRPVNLKDWAFFYEWGYARFGDERYLEILGAVERSHVSERRRRYQLCALFYGVETLPETLGSYPRKNKNFPASGFAVLTQGQDTTTTWIAQKYDPWTGSHSHADKLSYLIYHNNNLITADPGITEYGSKFHVGWYRTTLAHNTLVINEKNHQRVTGKSIAFDSNDTLSCIVTDAGPIYGDALQLRRTLALLDKNLVLVIDHIASQEPALLDWVYHQNGNWDERPVGKPWDVPQKKGYQYMKDAREISFNENIRFSTAIKKMGKVNTTLHIFDKGTLITANGLGHDFKMVPMVMIRKRTKTMTVVQSTEINTSNYEIQIDSVKNKDGKMLSQEEALIINIKKDNLMKFRLLVNPFQKALIPDKKGKVSTKACKLL